MVMTLIFSGEQGNQIWSRFAVIFYARNAIESESLECGVVKLSSIDIIPVRRGGGGRL